MRILISLLIFVALLLPQPVSAHSGRTDAWGCHNCYTSYCAGEYHCHPGGSGVGNSGGGTTGLIPTNTKNGEWNYTLSNEDWCRYDLTMTWDKPLLATKYSIAANKYAGADPGPLADTTTPSYTFKNLVSGKWFVNLKSGNAYGWSTVSYWTVDLPQPPSSLHAEIIQQDDDAFFTYDFSCLEKVDGPQEFIDYLNANNNVPSGAVRLSYSEPTTLNIKGWDHEGKEYSQSLTYTPPGTVLGAASSQANWELLTPLAFIGGAIGWGVLSSIWHKLTKKPTS